MKYSFSYRLDRLVLEPVTFEEARNRPWGRVRKKRLKEKRDGDIMDHVRCYSLNRYPKHAFYCHRMLEDVGWRWSQLIPVRKVTLSYWKTVKSSPFQTLAASTVAALVVCQ